MNPSDVISLMDSEEVLNEFHRKMEEFPQNSKDVKLMKELDLSNVEKIFFPVENGGTALLRPHTMEHQDIASLITILKQAKGNEKEFRWFMAKSMEKYPEKTDYYWDALAVFYRRMGKFKESLKCRNKIALPHSDYLEIHRAEMLFCENQKMDAARLIVRHYQCTMENLFGSTTFMRLALAMAHVKEWGWACFLAKIAFCKQDRDHSRDMHESLALIALMYFRLEEYGEAIHSLCGALQVHQNTGNENLMERAMLASYLLSFYDSFSAAVDSPRPPKCLMCLSKPVAPKRRLPCDHVFVCSNCTARTCVFCEMFPKNPSK